MDIKDRQQNIDGTLDEIIRLASKKFSNISVIPITKHKLLNNINHTIISWDKYVNLYTSHEAVGDLNIYDIDIVNMMLYIFKIYGKIINYQFTTNSSLFMESYTKFKEPNILRQHIAKINSHYNLGSKMNANLNFKRCSEDVKTLVNTIINIINTHVIDYQLSTVANGY